MPTRCCAVFHDLYRENWGPRTQDILHAALLTLANRPGMTLCALPVLLSNQRFRRKAVAGLTDEVALKPVLVVVRKPWRR